MTDRGRYDSAMFWLAFGTAAAVIGLALMTIGVSRSTPGASLLASPWFDSGAGLLALGALMLLWALGLYLGRRRAKTISEQATALTTREQAESEASPMTEAVKGYYAERERLMKMWERDRNRRSKSKR